LVIEDHSHQLKLVAVNQVCAAIVLLTFHPGVIEVGANDTPTQLGVS
jgi:hypothetical protein